MPRRGGCSELGLLGSSVTVLSSSALRLLFSGLFVQSGWIKVRCTTSSAASRLIPLVSPC